MPFIKTPRTRDNRNRVISPSACSAHDISIQRKNIDLLFLLLCLRMLLVYERVEMPEQEGPVTSGAFVLSDPILLKGCLKMSSVVVLMSVPAVTFLVQNSLFPWDAPIVPSSPARPSPNISLFFIYVKGDMTNFNISLSYVLHLPLFSSIFFSLSDLFTPFFVLFRSSLTFSSRLGFHLPFLLSHYHYRSKRGKTYLQQYHWQRNAHIDFEC